MKIAVLIFVLIGLGLCYKAYNDTIEYQKRHECYMLEMQAYSDYEYRMRICQYMDNTTGCPIQSDILLLKDLEYIKAQGCYDKH